MIHPKTDLDGHVGEAHCSASNNSGAASLITAAGTGDNTKVTGATIDRKKTDSCVLHINYLATLQAAETISFTVELQHDDDSAMGSPTTVALYAKTAVATGAGNKSGVLKVNVPNWHLYDRYVRFNVTPDLSASGTDTALFTACAVIGGYKHSEDA